MTVWRSRAVSRLAGIVAFLLAWELVGRYTLFGPAFPAISEILTAFESERSQSLFLRAFTATVSAALWAFLLAAIAALSIALISAVIPALENGLDTLATVFYAIPVIAFGPVLILLAGSENTPVILGVLSAYFPIYIALSSALRFAPPVYDDLSGVLGASRTRSFLLLKLPNAVPAYIDGLRMAAPAAVLGVILGEWFGAPRGLGIVIISSLQNFQIPQLWAAALLAVGCTFTAYMILSGVYSLALERFSWVSRPQ